MVGGLLALYTIPVILDSAGDNWDVPMTPLERA
jgi:hypothetical protein